MPRGCYMKQTLQNRFPRRWLLLAFVLNFAIAAAALLPYMIRDGGLLLVAADFDAEQLSYNMLCNNAIKSGEVLWNWRIDIGSDFVSSFSFYTLGQPVFLAELSLPRQRVSLSGRLDLYAQICCCRADLVCLLPPQCQREKRPAWQCVVCIFRFFLHQRGVLSLP